MKKIPTLLTAIGTTVVLLSSCKKSDLVTPQVTSNLISGQQTQLLTQQEKSGANGYGPGAVYQVELSANIGSPQGGGVWLWIGLYPNWEGDYSGSDCGHGEGAASDKGDVTWHYAGPNNSWIVIDGVVLNGLAGFQTTITVPATYGHYTGTAGTYLTLPPFIPSFAGFSQLQVAK
jgi:hypothetical protein